VCWWLCTVVHNTALNSFDNLPSYPPGNIITAQTTSNEWDGVEYVDLPRKAFSKNLPQDMHMFCLHFSFLKGQNSEGQRSCAAVNGTPSHRTEYLKTSETFIKSVTYLWVGRCPRTAGYTEEWDTASASVCTRYQLGTWCSVQHSPQQWKQAQSILRTAALLPSLSTQSWSKAHSQGGLFFAPQNLTAVIYDTHSNVSSCHFFVLPPKKIEKFHRPSLKIVACYLPVSHLDYYHHHHHHIFCPESAVKQNNTE